MKFPRRRGVGEFRFRRRVFRDAVGESGDRRLTPVPCFVAGSPSLAEIPWRRFGSAGDAVWIGVAQGLAVLPGLSRSGTTVATPGTAAIPGCSCAR